MTMIYNAKCKLCGSDGYQGFVDFECSNIKCGLYVTPPTNTFVSTPITHTSLPKTIYEIQTSTAMVFLNNLYDSCIVNEAKIAGGAARDWFFGNEARDIDIFCENFNLSAFQKMINTIGDSLYGAKICPASKKANKASYGILPKNQSLVLMDYSEKFEVWDVKFRGLDIQIIDTKHISIDTHISTFDFGINMISVDRDGVFIKTPEFNNDYLNMTLTIYPSRNSDPDQSSKLYKRYEKMKTKFPNFKLEMGK